MIDGLDLQHHVGLIVKKVGNLQLSYFTKARSLSRHDKNGAGFVTEADLASEKMLIQELKQVIPGAGFFAEESGVSGNKEYRWVIDPLDGTTNFAHGLPYFCISIALTYKDEVLFGMIYNPVLSELFWAQKGKGAWLNGNKIQVTDPQKFDQSLLVVGLPYEANGDYKGFLKKVFSIVSSAYGFRYLGASALDLAYVACGRFDGMFFSHLEWWDFAVGDLLIREAGGNTTDFAGNTIRLGSKTFIGGGNRVYGELLRLLGGE